MSEEELSEVDEVAALLSEAAELHAAVYRITDDEDADWATWYAKWLLELSELTDLLGIEPPQSELVFELVRLDREYNEIETDDPWELFYAEQLLEVFATDEEAEDDEDEDDEEIDENDFTELDPETGEVINVDFEQTDDTEDERAF